MQRCLGHVIRHDGEVDGESEQHGDGRAHLLPGVRGQSEDQGGGQGQEEDGEYNGNDVVGGQALDLHLEGHPGLVTVTRR